MDGANKIVLSILSRQTQTLTDNDQERNVFDVLKEFTPFPKHSMKQFKLSNSMLN